MSVVSVLAIILFVLMRIIGGERGTTSFLSLFLNLGMLFLAIMLMVNNANAILVTLITCAVVSYINLFFVNGINIKTKAALCSTGITIVVLFFLIVLFHQKAMIQGFGVEEIEEFNTFSFYVDVDYRVIGICTMVMGTIAAITDTAISISSAMNEVYVNNPLMKRFELFRSGITIGKDILGTTANTLLFSFIGGYLSLLLYFRDLDYSVGEAINSKVFSSEILATLIIGFGSTLIIPITAGLTTRLLTKKCESAKEVVVEKEKTITSIA